MSDVFSLMEEEVDAGKFDNINKDGASRLSNLIRHAIQVDKDIENAEQHLKDLKFNGNGCGSLCVDAVLQHQGERVRGRQRVNP